MISLYNRVALGSRIKTIRKRRGENQSQFGGHFVPPVSKGGVSRWESGNTKPNAKRLGEIAKLGDVTVDFLVNGDSTTPEDAQKLLNKIIEQPQLANIEEKKKLNGIKLELQQKLDLNDRISDNSIRSDRRNALLNDLKSETNVLNEELNDSDLVTIDLLFKIFNFLKIEDNSANLQMFNEILRHIYQITEGQEKYNSKTDLQLVDKFLLSLTQE